MLLETAVYCDEDYYGADCDVYCVLTDNCSGHYYCEEGTGDRICLSGWQGAKCKEATTQDGECPLTPLAAGKATLTLSVVELSSYSAV